MSNLTKANSARTEKAINIQYRWANGKIASFKEMIADGYFGGATIYLVPSVKFNRLKYNRMSYSEQKVYEQKLNKSKKRYALVNADDDTVSTDCPKLVFDYFVAKHPEIEIQERDLNKIKH